MRSMILAAVAALAFASAAGAAPHCDKGVPCGNSCIARGKVCHIAPKPVCKVGKLCGNTCIKTSDTCHKAG